MRTQAVSVIIGGDFEESFRMRAGGADFRGFLPKMKMTAVAANPDDFLVPGENLAVVEVGG